jgi:putative addiction module killer protein
MQEIKILEFVDERGHSPFRTWIDTLPLTIRARIQARILRIKFGNLGDFKSISSGLYEFRFIFGPGYRVYCGIVNPCVILILLGGTKHSQKRDINKAKIYWHTWNGVNRNDKKKP